MKVQIRHISLHQNAKVFALLFALSSLVLIIPISIFAAIAAPAVDAQGNPTHFNFIPFLLLPIFYLIVGYLSSVVGAAIYNQLVKFLGGFEFETTQTDQTSNDQSIKQA